MTVAYVDQPITFARSGKTAPNRFLKSAMTERLCTYDQKNLDERGKPTPEYVKLYEEWGKGGTGTIILGNIPVDREGLEAKGNAIIDAKSPWDAVEAFKPVIAATKAHGSLCIGQLTHGGRQTSVDVVEIPRSSSDVQAPDAMGMNFGKPKPLTVEEIDQLVLAWGHAAEVLYKAGADGAQIHAAHGYLHSQFLSGRVNKRTDDYGGSLENRARFTLRCVEEIKKRTPKEFIISIKMNSADFAEGGFDDKDSKIVSGWLEQAGLDLIELSGGTYESGAFEHKKESTKKRESYFIEFAEGIKPSLKSAKICVTGGFRSRAAMEQAIKEGSTDLVGLARPLTAEPDLPNQMIADRTEKAKENLVDAPLTTPASIAQIGAIAHGKPIPDLSQKEVAQQVMDGITGKKPENKPAEGQNTSDYAA